jgi:uncharacterized protein RhaS with RHS repeats
MGARVYDPYTGTFTQPDPIHGGGDNAYGYTDGDPVNETDLNGDDALPLPFPPAVCADWPEGTVACTAWLVANGYAWWVFEHNAAGIVSAIGNLFSSSNQSSGPPPPPPPTGANGPAGTSQPPDGAALKRQGQEILGRGHSPAAKQRWNDWWAGLSSGEKKAYNDAKGPKPRKRN